MALTKVFPRMMSNVPISVKDFGAVGDGVADDTTAIQAAIDTFYAGTDFEGRRIGGTLLFPRGTYRVTSTIDLNPPSAGNSGLKIIGEGAHKASILCDFSTAITGLDFNGASAFIMEDIRITNLGSGDIGLRLDTLQSNCRIQNVLIDNFARGCVVKTNSYLGRFDQVRIEDSSEVGLIVEGNANNFLFTDCEIIRAPTLVRIQGDQSGIIFKNCDLESFNLCFEIKATEQSYGVLTVDNSYIEPDGIFADRPEATSPAVVIDDSTSTVPSAFSLRTIFTNCFIQSGDDRIWTVDKTTQSRGVSFQDCMFGTDPDNDCLLADDDTLTVFRNCSFTRGTFNVSATSRAVFEQGVSTGQVSGPVVGENLLMEGHSGGFAGPVINVKKIGSLHEPDLDGKEPHILFGTNRIFMNNDGIPSSGSYNRGDVIFNTTPSAGGTIGYVCVTSGSPGTWKTWGDISA